MNTDHWLEQIAKGLNVIGETLQGLDRKFEPVLARMMDPPVTKLCRDCGKPWPCGVLYHQSWREVVVQAEVTRVKECGCVLCVCGGDRCLGCGAKYCEAHNKQLHQPPPPHIWDSCRHPWHEQRDDERNLVGAYCPSCGEKWHIAY